MNPDPFDEWLQKTAAKNRAETIPPQILERLPKNVVTQLHDEKKRRHLLMLYLGLTLLLGAVATVVTLTHQNVKASATAQIAALPQTQDTHDRRESPSDEEIVSTLANLEEERLWQLGPEIYSANLEAMDWVAVGR